MSSASAAIEEMARELEVDVPVRHARVGNIPGTEENIRLVPSGSIRFVEDQTRRAPTLPDGPMTAASLREAAREAGLPIGDKAEDDEDYLDTVRHEAAHTCVALSLGLGVEWTDARSGQTKVDFGDLQDYRSVAEFDFKRAVVGAAGAVFTGTSRERAEIASDSAIVRNGRAKWDEASEECRAMFADRGIRSLYERITDALIEHGRLDAVELQRVLDDFANASSAASYQRSRGVAGA